MKTKFTRDSGNFEIFIDYIKSRKIPFQIEESNYTTTIALKNKSKTRYTFTDSFLPKSAFKAYALILRDVKQRDFLNFCNEHPLSQTPNIYFDHKPGLDDYFGTNVANYDLNGAYPQTIFNHGGISKQTFNYLQAIPKKARLAALGMLASSKTITKYNNGEIYAADVVTSIYAPVFNFCVKYVNDILTISREIVSGNFLFYWVDGIYIKENTHMLLLRELDFFIRESGYEFSVDFLQQFEYTVKQKEIINVRYWKPNADGSLFELKDFSFPYITGERLHKSISEYYFAKKKIKK